MQYFINRSGTVHGPFAFQQVENGLLAGKLSMSDQVSTSQQGPWSPLRAETLAKLAPTIGADHSTDSVLSLSALNHRLDELQEETRRAIAGLRDEIHNLRSQKLASVPIQTEDTPFMSENVDMPPPSVEAEAALGNWNIEIQKNPIDDSAVFVVSSEGQKGMNAFGQSPTLVLRQTGDESGKPKSLFKASRAKVEVFVGWGAYFSEDDLVVSVRIGGNKALKQKWGPLTDNNGTYYLGDCKAFIRELARGGTLAIEARPYQENPITAVWDCRNLVRSVLSKAPQLGSWFA